MDVLRRAEYQLPAESFLQAHTSLWQRGFLPMYSGQSKLQGYLCPEPFLVERVLFLQSFPLVEVVRGGVGF